MTIIVKSVSEKYGGVGGINSNDFNDIIDITKNPKFGGSINITKIDNRSVIIYSELAVDGLQFTYNVEIEGGATSLYNGNYYGSYGSSKQELILVDGEQMLEIIGKYGIFKGNVVIKYIELKTSKANRVYVGNFNLDDIEFTLPSGVIFGSTINNLVGSIGTVAIEAVEKTGKGPAVSTSTIFSSPSTVASPNLDNVSLTRSPTLWLFPTLLVF